MRKLTFILLLMLSCISQAQHSHHMIATLESESDVLHIKDSMIVKNDSDVSWDKIVMLDWAHAFSSKDTPLANRFAEDFKNKFQFAPEDDRGKTVFKSSTANLDFTIKRLPHQVDIIELILNEPLLPGASKTIVWQYDIVIPEDDFTGYGKSSTGNYALRYWYITPAVFDQGEWQYFSHKGINDYYPALANYSISLHLPTSHQVVTNAPIITSGLTDYKNSYLLKGNHLAHVELYLEQNLQRYKNFGVPDLNVTTDIEDGDVPPELKALFIDRISGFLNEKLGSYAYPNMLITDRYYREDPVYGLSSLPSFINPFPAGFTYEIKVIKAMTRKWLESGARLHPRDENWLQDGMMVYLLQQYNQTYYPNLKIAGKLSNIWGIRGFNITQLDFNDQYNFLYLNTARLNLDQSITTRSDSLVKYNQQLGIINKAAIGLKYLQDYSGNNSVDQTIKEFYQKNKLKLSHVSDFKTILESKNTKDIDWFFKDYITKYTRMDWKIKRVKNIGDSVKVFLKNKSDRDLPIALYSLDKDSIVEKIWIDHVVEDTVITLSRKRANRISLNYEKLIPEFTMHDNYKTLKGFAQNRPIEFRLFKDIEDPERAQVFLMPDLGFNVYDGVTVGARFSNGTLLPKPFRYTIKPIYGLNSNKVIGSVGLSYTHNLEKHDESIYFVRYGVSANRFSYADDLLYRRASAWLNLGFRPKDLRSNKRSFLTFRNVLVDRDRDPANPVNEPDYNVFSINYNNQDRNFKRYFSYNAGVEVSSRFSKATFRTQWRKLFKDNRQLNIRFFSGAFLHNETQNDGNFFSFALDRPTDYLFDYNYYGRSDESGFFSQQLIIAEGGFKSQLETPYANQFISTVNTSYSIWKYVFAYADVGVVKNRNTPLAGVYDSGLRLNLLQDYFEVYLPIYSSNGWEVGQGDYDQRVRFILTLDLNTLTGLFTRRWY
ncbi:MAG: aminopeptidase [Nonlabens ulvanivorans]|uniref:aminopeptidase n=3 Tax=Nonlabens ulvanivorans TaxID=906888 RepID=UPI003264CAAB